MKKRVSFVWLPLALLVLAVWPAGMRAQGSFKQVTGKTFESALPKDFYLEGNAIPTQERNAALLKTPEGARVLFALIDTTGYSSRIKEKYMGMLITEGKLSVCGISVGVGSYGFGLDRPAPPSNAEAKFMLYNQAGQRLGECGAKRDETIKQPRPLSAVVSGGSARLYLGRYELPLK
jgi:hypothetical protein